jgi:hypothetical protein
MSGLTDRSSAAERERAERQATAIVNFWADRGYSVCAIVRAGPFCPRSGCKPCIVETDLVDGLPRDFRVSRVERLRMRRAA